jgi:hypothetical protein
LVVRGGSLTPEVENEEKVDAYWQAVEETRRRRGDVLVAQVAGEVVGVCQVLVFPHFQHTGGWCCELESVHVRSDLLVGALARNCSLRPRRSLDERGATGCS